MARKQGTHGFRPKLVALAVASCFATSAVMANPTAPTVVHGAANITNPAANILNIATTTPQTIINWGSFSISVGELTRFMQPSAASAVLNRVIGGDPSAILGALQSNGRVFIVNPSGIVFGAGSQVDVAGLIATSLNISNADFLANRMNFTGAPGAGSIVNQGNITARGNEGQGGQVYLIGPAVTNNGIITTPKGEVVLAAGNSVELVNPGTPNLRVEIAAADNEARNLGQIIAESGRIGIYAGLINNSGTIRADSAVAEGGKILLKATKSVTLESSSILDASGNGGGRIEVLAKNGGTVKVDGLLDASAPVSGDGGFIETSADKVTIADSAVVRATSATGKRGLWLIDPNDFTIASYGGDISGSTLGFMLDSYGGTDVAIASDSGAYGGNGDIFVYDNVSWSYGGTLTLNAHRNIEMSGVSIHNFGTGSVAFNAGLGTAGDIMLSGATINVGGNVNLNASQDILIGFSSVDAGGNIAFMAGRDISVASSRAWAGTGSPFGDRSLMFSAGRDISVTAPDGSSNVEATTYVGNATASMSAGGSITIQGSDVYASVDGAEGGNAMVAMTAGGNVAISNSEVEAYIYSGSSSIPGGSATVNITSGGAFTLSNSSVYAQAGSGSTGGNAVVNLIGGTNFSADGAEGSAYGGYGYNGNGGSAGVLIGSGGSLSLSNTDLYISGGSAGSSPNGNGGDAVAVIAAAGPVTLNDSYVSSYGGYGTGSGSGGNAAALLVGGSLNINQSSIHVDGGEGSIGGSGFIGMLADGKISITNTQPVSVSAMGGGGTSAGGSALMELTAGSGIDIVNDDVSVSGGSGPTQGGAGILLNFPLLTSGGFTVNGVDGAISDGSFGFFVNGAPAILGENLLITYLVQLPPAVVTAINQSNAMINEQSNITDNTNQSGANGDPEEDKQKKQLPICGR